MGIWLAFLSLLFQGMPFPCCGLNHSQSSPITQISQVGIQSVAGANVTTAAITTSTATLLVIVCTYISGTTVTIGDSKSNTWFPLTARTNAGGNDVRIWYAKNAIVGTNHTFSASAAGAFYPSLEAMAFSNVSTSAPFDQENGTANGSGTTIQTGSITPSANDSLIIAGAGWSVAASGGTTINSGFNTPLTEDYGTGNNYGSSMAYNVQGTAAAINPIWIFVVPQSSSAVIASFK